MLIAELIFYGAIFSTAFLISVIGVLVFDPESRAEFIKEVLK